MIEHESRIVHLRDVSKLAYVREVSLPRYQDAIGPHTVYNVVQNGECVALAVPNLIPSRGEYPLQQRVWYLLADPNHLDGIDMFVPDAYNGIPVDPQSITVGQPSLAPRPVKVARATKLAERDNRDRHLAYWAAYHKHYGTKPPAKQPKGLFGRMREYVRGY